MFCIDYYLLSYELYYDLLLISIIISYLFEIVTKVSYCYCYCYFYHYLYFCMCIIIKPFPFPFHFISFYFNP